MINYMRTKIVDELKVEGLTTRRGHHRRGERYRPKDRSGAKTSSASAYSEYSIDEDNEVSVISREEESSTNPTA